MRNPSSEAASGKGKDLTCSKKIGLKRGPWTPEEDTLLASFVRREGEGKWRTLPRRAGLLRCGKSCRLRWMNYLRPSVKRGQIEPDEEDLILRLHRLLGNRKRLISQGIDPRTHKSLNAEIPSASHQKDHAQAPTVAPANPNPNFHPKPSATRENSGDLNSALHRQEDSCFFFERADLEQRTAWQNFDGSSREALPNQNVENETEFCNDELFASFLESLVGDDVFQHVPPGPPVFQVPAYGGHTLWDPASDASPAVPLDRNYSFPPTEDRNKQI